MAETAVTFLLENVSVLLKHYVDLISNAKDEMQSLENDLKLLQSFLQEAATKSKKEEPYRELERQIRQVVYEAEDTIDKCLILAAEPKGRRFLGRLNPNRVSMAEQVKDLNSKKLKPMVNRAINDFAKMEIAGGPAGTSDAQPAFLTARATPTSQDNIVGLEDEEEKIMGFLSEQTRELDVVSIIGMPGLGKTTLASKIYHNKDMRYDFPVHIWVYVSKAFNRKEVLLTILRKFENHDRSNLQEQDLAERVRSHLEEVKFFLILDDIWTIEAWKSIQAVLPKNNFSSKVLITSRFTNVCQVANPSRTPHTLRFLYPDESWKLLQLQVFGKVDGCPKELETVGILIARECDGLPLAIVVIGGYLLGLKSPNTTTAVLKNKWVEVSKNLDKYLLRDDDQSIAISNIVSWSYNSLPTELRECFIYLAVFPENKEIQTWTLMHLWIAEGFIQHKPGQGSLEETAMENLNGLIARNLVIAGRTNPNGEVKTIRVHDLIRAFCTSKASATDQNLFQEIKKTNGVFDPKVTEIHNHRRICIHSNIEDFLSEQPKGPHVRSFLCFDNGSSELGTNYTTSIPDAFELLRVLDSKSIKFKKFPSRVSKMVHLRYITVSVDNLDLLPEAVSTLWNLQTIVIETKQKSLTIEANIWKMFQLRHLKTKASIILTPHKEAGKGSDKGSDNLQTLGRLSPESCSKEVFAKASKLRRLGIRGNLVNVFNENCIDKLAYLEKLKLVNDIHLSKSKDTLSRLPQSGWFPTILKRLTITSTSLGWEQISTLTTIKNLEILKLKDNAFVGIEWKLYNDCFSSLHFLLIENTDLITWEASTRNFPELKTLVLNNCEALKEIPIGLAEKLEKVEMDNMGETAVESAVMIEEYSKKLKPEQEKGAWGGRFSLSIGPGCKRSTKASH